MEQEEGREDWLEGAMSSKKEKENLPIFGGPEEHL